MKQQLEVGTRVKVRIANPKEWAAGAVRVMNGLRGTVEALAVNPTSSPYRVRFDPHTRGHWNQGKRVYPVNVDRFHFGREDLIEALSPVW